MSLDMDQFHEVYFVESFELLDQMEAALLRLAPGDADVETVNTIFRVAHSIKGGAGMFGFGEIAFLSEPAYVLPTLAAIGIWQLVGFNMVLFLAGLSAIPRDLYEAAEIDGCRSGIDRFLTITWPLLGPTTMFVIVTTSITAFKVFDTVAVMTRGGPMGASEVLLYAIYLEGYQYFHMGYAAALAWFFALIIVGLTIIQMQMSKRWVFYYGE